MLEKDGAYTVELSKNGKLIESYSTFNQSDLGNMVKKFCEKIKPKFSNNDVMENEPCENEIYSIHLMTF